MHKLARQVRFSINPFLSQDSIGFNSFAAMPAGEGLAIFLELCVEITDEMEPKTGFVVNVVDIDSGVRQYAVPIFAKQIRQDFALGKHIGFVEVGKLLKKSQNALTDKFGTAKLSRLSLKLNPYRKIGIDCEDSKMIYFSEKFEFAATHKLWNDDFSKKKNLEVFGKCANSSGHGHNYAIEVTIKKPEDAADFLIGDFEKVVDSKLIKLVDHKNLNIDVPHFSKVIPTVENIAVFAWGKLNGKFGEAMLHCITVWETDKTSCSYYG